jgi:hypothetical protein
MEQKVEKKMGWEVAREVEAQKPSLSERAKISGEQLRSFIKWGVLFGLLFVVAVWLAGNPFEFTQRVPSDYVKARGWVGTNEWGIIWMVVLAAPFSSTWTRQAAWDTARP